MNIGVIGFESAGSMPQRLCEELNAMKLGRLVQFSINVIVQRISPSAQQKHTYWKHYYSMREALFGHLEHDLLFVEQSYLYMVADVSCPIMYHHAELNSPITIRIPDSHRDVGLHSWLAMKLLEADDVLHSWCGADYDNYTHKFYMLPAAHPPFFKPDRKKDVSFSWIGPPDDTFIKTRRDYYWNRMELMEESIVQYCSNNNICRIFNDTPVTYAKYVNLMERSKFALITSNEGVYMGRRVMECSLAGAVPVVWIENDRAEKWFRDAGWDETNSIFFRHMTELKGIKLMIDAMPSSEWDLMAATAYKNVAESHTFKNRAQQLLEEYKKCENVKKTQTSWEKYDITVEKGKVKTYEAIGEE